MSCDALDLKLTITCNLSNIYNVPKLMIGGPLERKIFFSGGVCKVWFYDDDLKSGFGFSLLLLVLHGAHSQPPNWWTILPTKSLYSWKVLKFNPWMVFGSKEELLGIMSSIREKKFYNKSMILPKH